MKRMRMEVVVLPSASNQWTPPQQPMEKENGDPDTTVAPFFREAEGELVVLLKFIGYSNI